jgi:hypothetical protein
MLSSTHNKSVARSWFERYVDIELCHSFRARKSGSAPDAYRSGRRRESGSSQRRSVPLDIVLDRHRDQHLSENKQADTQLGDYRRTCSRLPLIHERSNRPRGLQIVTGSCRAYVSTSVCRTMITVAFSILEHGLSQYPSMAGLRSLALILALYHCLPHEMFWLLAS